METESGDTESELRKRTSQYQAALRDMDALTYSVSHDLRAPLRAVIGFSQALEHESGKVLNDQAQDYLKRVLQSAERMNVMLNQLLTFSRCSRPEPALQPVNLSELAARVARDATQKAERANVALKIQPGQIQLTDEGYVQSVLEILFDNAIKFTARQPNPRIEFGSQLHESAREFFVRDNGVGFNPEFAAKLFAPFQRLHAVEDFPGDGMGLARARRMLDRVGGSIRAEGQPGKGATFYFTLGG